MIHKRVETYGPNPLNPEWVSADSLCGLGPIFFVYSLKEESQFLSSEDWAVNCPKCKEILRPTKKQYQPTPTHLSFKTDSALAPVCGTNLRVRLSNNIKDVTCVECKKVGHLDEVDDPHEVTCQDCQKKGGWVTANTLPTVLGGVSDTLPYWREQIQAAVHQKTIDGSAKRETEEESPSTLSMALTD